MFKQMIKKSIHKSQHCQRNWDLSKSIPKEDVELIIDSAVNCPTKQNLNFYKVHAITDRDKIQKIHDKTQGFEVFGEDRQVVDVKTNSQTLANLLLVFAKDSPSYARENQEMNNEKAKTYEEDRHIAVGIAAGYVNLTSTMLGYSTGCCKCFDSKEVKNILNSDSPILLMGIGYADNEKIRTEHQEDENFRFPTFKNQRTFEIHA